MQVLKRAAITLVGGLILLIGLIFIILPGPAIIVIPLGLMILAKEYPQARHWLHKFQRHSNKMAQKMDSYFTRRKWRRR